MDSNGLEEGWPGEARRRNERQWEEDGSVTAQFQKGAKDEGAELRTRFV